MQMPSKKSKADEKPRILTTLESLQFSARKQRIREARSRLTFSQEFTAEGLIRRERTFTWSRSVVLIPCS
jgi:hypothetical protein